MRIFVAGATGAIGQSLVSVLVAHGHKVWGMTRSVERADFLRSLGAEPVVVDAFDRRGVFTALEDSAPEVVIHQLTDLSTRNFAANARLRIEGTRNLVDASRAVGVRRMVAQSIAFVYTPGEGPATEEEPLDLAGPPARRLTVEAVDYLERAVGEMPEACVLRYGTLYGPGTWYAANGPIAEAVRRGELRADKRVTSFVHVTDSALVVLNALTWTDGIYNVVDDEPAAAESWLPVYAAVLGAPAPLAAPDVDPRQRGASNRKVRRLGWQPRYPSWRDGFHRALGGL